MDGPLVSRYLTLRLGHPLFRLGRCVTRLPQICLYNLDPFGACFALVRVELLIKEEEMHTTFSKVVLELVVVIGMTSLAVAQRTTATFAGIVTDPTSAVLPGASVQLINEGTNAVTEKITGETGEFLFDYVPVGAYTLKISLAGFKTYESRSIPLGAE